MKFKLVFTVDQTQVGNVLAAMQQSDAEFEGPEILPVVEPRALPPPRSPPQLDLPLRGQAPPRSSPRPNTLPSLTLNLIKSRGTVTNRDVKKMAKSIGYAPSGVGAMLSKMQGRGQIHQPRPNVWAAGSAPPWTKGDNISGTEANNNTDEGPG